MGDPKKQRGDDRQNENLPRIGNAIKALSVSCNWLGRGKWLENC